MSSLEQVEQELREYLDKEPNLRRQDKLVYLRAIFDKHLTLSKLEHELNYFDFHEILCGAKIAYSNLRLPMRISRKPIDGSEVPNVAMIESVMSYLNKHSLLKRLVRIEYTE
jgi:hypothetical protein